MKRWTVEMEIPAINTWLQVSVCPEGSLDTCSFGIALAGLEYWRKEYPVSSFRIIEWTGHEIS